MNTSEERGEAFGGEETNGRQEIEETAGVGDNAALKETQNFCLSRRQFLFGGGAAAATVLLSSFPGFLQAKEKPSLRMVGYPRKKIYSVSKLKVDDPVAFTYPHQHPNCSCFLVKLGKEAAGGVGPQKDIVAFSSLCAHMGGPLSGQYKPKYKAIGPCPMHLTTFDLRRHGMVVSGHATESLPQIVLEVKGGAIYATGVMGLLYGFSDNKISV